MNLFQVTKKQVIENYELRTMTGDIVSFTPSYSQLLPDPFSDLNVKCNVEATQSGSGAPYPPGGGKNKFDKETVNHGYLINGMGNYVSYPDSNVSDYTPVVEGVGYYLYGLTKHPNTFQDNFELFDSSKTKVGYANVRTNEYPYTIPNGVKFVRFTVHDDDLNTAMFATSEGEYEPYSNIRPINGYSSANITRCGKNFLPTDYVRRSGYNTPTATINNGVITITNYDVGGRFIAFNVFVDVGTTVTIRYSDSSNINGIGYVFADDKPTSWVSYGTPLPNANTDYVITTTKNWLQIYIDASANNATVTNLQIEVGSASTPYAPYNGQTYAIAFGQTVYGGVLDVTRGKLTVTCAINEDMSELSWLETSTPHVFYTGVSGKKAGYTSFLLCEQYSKYEGYVSGIGNNQISSNNSLEYIYVRNDNCTTVTDITTALSGCKLVYELATPFDIDLTPVQIRALAGENNVFADCGETTVTCLI